MALDMTDLLAVAAVTVVVLVIFVYTMLSDRNDE